MTRYILSGQICSQELTELNGGDGRAGKDKPCRVCSLSLLSASGTDIGDSNWLDSEPLNHRGIDGAKAGTGINQSESRHGVRRCLAGLLKLSGESCWNLDLNRENRPRQLQTARKWLWKITWTLWLSEVRKAIDWHGGGRGSWLESFPPSPPA